MFRQESSTPNKSSASKIITKTGNVAKFADREISDTSELVVPKTYFYDKVKQTKFVIDACRKDIVQYKTERDVLQFKLKEIEKVADTQLNMRKELENKVNRLNDELLMVKNKHQTKFNAEMMPQTEDISTLTKLLEDEVRANMEQNKRRSFDPYLESIRKKYEI